MCLGSKGVGSCGCSLCGNGCTSLLLWFLCRQVVPDSPVHRGFVHRWYGRVVVCWGKGARSHTTTIAAVYTPTIQNAFRKEAYWAGEPVELIIRDTAGQNEVSDFHLHFSAGVHGWVYVRAHSSVQVG